jgi:hypothetical protein
MRLRIAIVLIMCCSVVAGWAFGRAAVDRAAGRGHITRSAVRYCDQPARLAAGVGVAAWRLGSVEFTSARSGVALTAPAIPCIVPPGGGTFIGQTVRLAVSDDGGLHWVTTGSVLPDTTPSAYPPVHVAAVAGPDVWVVSDTGVMLQTRDDGTTWTRLRVPAPVVAAASAGGWLWVLSCPASGSACRPLVERMRLPGGSWTRTDLVTPPTQQGAQLVVSSARAAAVAVSGPHPTLAGTADGGTHWSTRPLPATWSRLCEPDYIGSLVTAGPDDWWLLCTGGAAAGSSTKALFRSADGGRTWTVASALASLSAPARPGSLPYSDSTTIAAASPDLLWIAGINSLSVSTDGGACWSMTQVNPLGYPGQFDVLSRAAAWLLAPGAGLWQTTSGTTWRELGSPPPPGNGGPAGRWPTGPAASAAACAAAGLLDRLEGGLHAEGA